MIKMQLRFVCPPRSSLRFFSQDSPKASAYSFARLGHFYVIMGFVPWLCNWLLKVFWFPCQAAREAADSQGGRGAQAGGPGQLGGSLLRRAFKSVVLDVFGGGELPRRFALFNRGWRGAVQSP